MTDGLIDKHEQDRPTTGPFNNKADLLLQRAGNGGWVVTARPERDGLLGENIGAYSTTKDMLYALGAALKQED